MRNHYERVNVQHSFLGTIKGVAEQAVQHHHDEGIKALAGACKLLDDAQLTYTYHISVGEVGDVVAHFVKELNIDQVVMGCTDSGAVANMLRGSTARGLENDEHTGDAGASLNVRVEGHRCCVSAEPIQVM